MHSEETTVEWLREQIAHLSKCIDKEDDKDARLSMRMMRDRMYEDLSEKAGKRGAK